MEQISFHGGRRRLILLTFFLVVVLLMWRTVQLQVFNKDFLQRQGDARSVRVVTVPAHRGIILDRYGSPLAVSTPVDSVWANPREVSASPDQWRRLSRALRIPERQLRRRIQEHSQREFVYLKRHIPPSLGREIAGFGLPGVSLLREYRRYYPTGEIAAHVLGFTNIDDRGQEGIELAFDEWLRGVPGKKRVIKDRLGRVVEDVANISMPVAGRTLNLSLDRRLQYLAYRALKAAVLKQNATAGSVVVVDARTGEILAMVNQPSFNPNRHRKGHGGRFRNRAVTDLLEPGSTIKPFTIAAALESGQFSPDTMLDTTPGVMRVGRYTVRDTHNHGLIDLTTVIQKSSNIGAAKVALALPSDVLWNMYRGVGFGSSSGSEFPGEALGHLAEPWRWHRIEQATLAFGYGISVTSLQLARAYMVLANDGILKPVTFEHLDKRPAGKRVMSAKTARTVCAMLEKVVDRDGTGELARVPGYRVAGKTGTVHKTGASGYLEDHYFSVFAGMAPMSDPRLIVTVVIDDPQNGHYYAGQVAAPVFAEIMQGTLRLLDVMPDALQPDPSDGESNKRAQLKIEPLAGLRTNTGDVL